MPKFKNKNTGDLKNSLCSGYGVFPCGTKCKGCNDCKGEKNIDVKKVFDRNHTTIEYSGKKDLQKELKKIFG